jgi:hypothetical protein
MPLPEGLLMFLLAHNRDWFGQVSWILFNFQTKEPSNSNDSQQGSLLQHLHNVREISSFTDVALTHGLSLFHICGTICAEA